MDGRISMYVLLVCVWCSLDAGGLLMVVTAEPTVSAVILTPEADRKEGGQVDMRCVATNLESDHIVDWRTENSEDTLSWNDIKITINRRFMFITTYPERGEVVQDFTITDLQIDDYDQYFCNVKDPLRKGGYFIVAAVVVKLSPPPYPICSPSGPITLDTGTELPLRCLSDTDNPAVIMTTHPMTDPRNYPWTSSTVDDTNTLPLNLIVTVAGDVVVFKCSVFGSGADTMTRSCIIGRIGVTISEDVTDGITSIEPHITPTTSSNDHQPLSNPWVVASVIASILFVVLIIVIIIAAFKIFKLRRLIKRLTSIEAYQTPRAEQNIEQQPTEGNGAYLEPTATTTTQDTYYQPVAVENDSLEYDYARPEGSTNTSYEAVRKPQSSADRPYQNIDNSNKKRRLGVVVSPEIGYARPEGGTNIRYEAVRKPQSSADRPYQNIDNSNKKRRLGVVVSPEIGYARPEGSINTSSEAVRKPQSSADRPYQNIDNSNKKRRLGVVVSPEIGYARLEGSTNIRYEAVRKPQSSADRPYQNIDNSNKKRRLGVVVSPEIGYARPEGSTNIRYEAARKPHSSTDRRYQNYINNNNNKKRRLGVVVSPEIGYARPEGSTNTSYEAVRTLSSADGPYQNNINNNNNKKRRLGVVLSPEIGFAMPEGSTITSYEAIRKPQSSTDRRYQNINNNNNKKRRFGVVVSPEIGYARP